MGKSKVRVLHPNRNPDFNTGAYSDGIVSGGFLCISGQASVDFNTSKFMLGSIEEETRRTLDNVKAIVERAGCTMADVVKCTVHLADIADFATFNQVYTSFFGDIKPTRTTVQSVMAENIKVEIDAIVRYTKDK